MEHMKDHIRKAAKFLKSAPIIGGLFEKHPKVITIRFSGVIADSSMKRGGISYTKYASLLDKAFDKHEINAVAMIINSPGGAPAQTSLIANHIRRLSEEKEIPVYAFVEDVAASGGYWVACAADEIYAQATSIVGSIGVISASFGFEDFIAKHDIHRRVHTSGKEKSFMDPFTPESKADLDRLKSIQKDIHERFIDWVSERRSDKLNAKNKDLFEGGFWAAETAQNLGLIDGINDVYSFSKTKWGNDVKLIDMSPEKKSIMSLIPFGGKLEATRMNIAEDILDVVETRSAWSRYGL